MTRASDDKMPREPRSGSSIAGLTLVELMVAITIGLIILAAVARLFVTSRSTYTLEEGLARVQESGRFAMEFLSQDIRMAGYAGCNANLSGSQVNNMVDPPEDKPDLTPMASLAINTFVLHPVPAPSRNGIPISRRNISLPAAARFNPSPAAMSSSSSAPTR